MIDQTAPIGGLNYVNSDDLMEPSDAKVLDNWIPDAGYCRTRESEVVIADLTGVL